MMRRCGLNCPSCQCQIPRVSAIVDFLTNRRQKVQLGCTTGFLVQQQPPAAELTKDSRDGSGPQAQPRLPPQLTINGCVVSTLESLRFLDITICSDLRRERSMVSAAKRAQQRMFFLRQFKKLSMSQPLMIQFYKAIIKSIPTSFLTIWYGSSTSQEQAKLWCMMRTAE
ncbi:hypothetical protein NFI96_014122 [Prochilodus magdalenae]|nr:hypothetical protein NFI96_014122 [Prochilodus magdalenae]